jgi:hypothetical protein
LIICNTIIGFGSPNKQGKASSHGAALGDEEVLLARKQLGWKYEERFYVPEEMYEGWDFTKQGAELEKEWNNLFAEYKKQYPSEAAEFERRVQGVYPDGWEDPPGDPPDLNETIEIDDTFFEGVPEDTSEDTVIPSWRVTPLVAKAYKKLKRVETGVAAAHARGLDTTKGEASKDQVLADFVGSWIDANPDDTEFTGMHSMMSYFKNDAHEAWRL